VQQAASRVAPNGRIRIKPLSRRDGPDRDVAPREDLASLNHSARFAQTSEWRGRLTGCRSRCDRLTNDCNGVADDPSVLGPT
jgi:hypothetical protein